ncbi:hypothetical protein GCM10023168_11990 [Fodinibacter luteus]|uniref:IrrE N-terminal-like domain-containing protein n=1 Tax=Fodinibacter luteus TaxID=552064 RepID=A0ABP8K8N4_9MICO
MTWFAGVPREIEVAGVRLIRAEQAIEAGEPPNDWNHASHEYSERPDSDWVASQVLDLTRLQLLELRRVVEQILGADRPIIALEDVRSVLLERAVMLPEPDRNAAEYEVDTVVEGLELLEALPREIHVGHGFAVDGSISITTGPELPALPTIGVRGSDTGELEDEPDRLLGLAAALTRAAGELYWLLPVKAVQDNTQPQRSSPHDELLPVVKPSEVPPASGGRKVSGSPVFVAASRLDEVMLELTFDQALALTRLVIECGGGPAAVGGKRGLMTSQTAKHLTALGLVRRVEVGTVEAIYMARVPSVRDTLTAPELRVVGVRNTAKLAVEAAQRGTDLVREILLREGLAVPAEVPAQHPPLDRRQFGQLELDLGSPNPDEDDVARAVRGLIQEAMTYRDGPAVGELLRVIGRFTKLAPFNALLLDAQAPGCRHVLPAHKWLEDWSHRVKPGERPRIILRTFGPVLPVFDVSQVEPSGRDVPPLPQEIRGPFAMAPIVGVEHAFAQSAHTAVSEGIRISQTHDGAGSAGSARSGWGAGTLSVARSERSKPHLVPVTVDIEINRNLDPGAAYATLAHELGHVYCGHVGSPSSDLWPDRSTVTTETAECEAEAVAYIACLRLKPDVRMPPHLHQYLTPGAPVPPIDLEVVTKAAGRVINLYESPAEVWRRLSDRQKKARQQGRPM